jgi:hypothetical protein
MTDKEIEKLADILAIKVFNLIAEKQEELDAQFIKQLEESKEDLHITIQNDIFSKEVEDEETKLLRRLDELESSLELYIAEEMYKKAAETKLKIDNIKTKLKNL